MHQDTTANTFYGLIKTLRSYQQHRRHSRNRLAVLYFCLVFSTSIATSIYGAAFHVMPETMLFYQIYYGLLYALAIALMIFLMVYLFNHRAYTVEELQRCKNIKGRSAKYSLKGEEVNWYLRLGVIMFGIMSIIHTCLRITELARDVDCEYGGFYMYATLKIIYFIVQILFILSLHRMVLLTRLKLFGFILLQLLICAASTWVDSVVSKVATGILAMVAKEGDKIKEYSEQKSPKLLKHSELSECSGVNHKVKATLYFLPALSEFSAIVAAILYEIINRVGKYKQIEMGNHEQSKRQLKECLDRSVVGLFLSILLICGVFSLVVFLECLESTAVPFRYIVHLCEESGLLFIGLLACSLGFFSTRTLKFTVNFTPNNLDELLLYATFFVSVMFHMANIAISMLTLPDEKHSQHAYYLMAFRVANGFLEIAQGSLQTYFIQDSFYRCCKSAHEQKLKPGRNILALLLGLNMSLWMIKSFQVKHNDYILAKVLKGNSNILKSLFLHATLPMAMLFRFHSTVCLSISFTRMYEDEVSRFTSMLRGVATNDPIPRPQLPPVLNKTNRQLPSKTVSHKYAEQTMRKRAASIAVMETTEEAPVETVPKGGNRRKAILSNKLNREDRQRLQNPQSYQRRGTMVNMELAQMRLASNELSRKMMILNKKTSDTESDQSNTPSPKPKIKTSKTERLKELDAMFQQGVFNETYENSTTDSEEDLEHGTSKDDDNEHPIMIMTAQKYSIKPIEEEESEEVNSATTKEFTKF